MTEIQKVQNENIESYKNTEEYKKYMDSNTIYLNYIKKLLENPNKIAIFDEEKSLTRLSLNNLINTISNKIPKNTKRVGIIMDHNIEMIASILAVLKIGGAYIPIEPFFPKNRIEFVLKDGNATCIITNKKYSNKMPDLEIIYIERDIEIENNCNIDCYANPEDIAYILYTSGSTGMPKGVAVTNKNVCHYARGFINEFSPNDNDIMMQYSVCSFDIFVEEVFCSLISGMTLAIPNEESKKNIINLMDFSNKNKITILSGFPYLLQEINEIETIPESFRLMISGGDVLRYSYVDKLIKKVTIYNTYGPTETTVCCSYYNCTNELPLKDGTFPIGKPILDTDILILDDDLNPVEEGKKGEICILGNGVTLGYIGNRKKENESFIIYKDGRRLYKSGDLGYYLKDGNIAFLNRKDMQVMIYGKRVEPIEIETVINKNPNIKQSKVVSYQDLNGMFYLVAYVVWESKEKFNELYDTIIGFLPDYMVPEIFVTLKKMPINNNGKIDVKELPIVRKKIDCKK
jgi:amino acid adenylation domain-containing protein